MKIPFNFELFKKRLNLFLEKIEDLERVQSYMNTLIAEQLTALQDKKFVKYY